MDIGGEEEGIAAVVGDDADAADEVADLAEAAAGIGAAGCVRGTTEPGEVGFLLVLAFEFEGAVGGGIALVGVEVRLGLVLGLVGIAGPHGRRAIAGEQDIEAVGDGGGLGELEGDAEGAFAGLGGGIEAFEDFLDGGEAFLGIGGDDDAVGVGFAGDADLAVETADIAVGDLGRLFVVEIVGALLGGLLEEEFVEDVLDIDGADVLEGEDAGGEGFAFDGFVEERDHLLEAGKFGGRGLDDDDVAAAIGDDIDLLVGAAGVAGLAEDVIGVTV